MNWLDIYMKTKEEKESWSLSHIINKINSRLTADLSVKDKIIILLKEKRGKYLHDLRVGFIKITNFCLLKNAV